MKNQELQAALKLINEKCKEPNFYKQLEEKSLSNRIATLKSTFLSYVDAETINYRKTQIVKNHPDHDLEYRPVELSNREIEKALDELHWFKRDIEACINHLNLK